jgi:hypothetical protein
MIKFLRYGAIFSIGLLMSFIVMSAPVEASADNPFLQQYQSTLQQGQDTAYASNQQQLQEYGAKASDDALSTQQGSMATSPQSNPWVQANTWAAQAKNNPWAGAKPAPTTQGALAPQPTVTQPSSTVAQPIQSVAPATTPAALEPANTGTTNIYLPPTASSNQNTNSAAQLPK